MKHKSEKFPDFIFQTKKKEYKSNFVYTPKIDVILFALERRGNNIQLIFISFGYDRKGLPFFLIYKRLSETIRVQIAVITYYNSYKS